MRVLHITTTKWKKEKHTDAKHVILRKYLSVWIPILASSGSDLIYIDGFAGPGEYNDKKTGLVEPGSPIIALEAFKNQVVRFKSKMHFVFIEKDKKRCENLKIVLDKYSSLKNASIEEPICGFFDIEVSNLLDNIEEHINKLTKKTGKSYQRVPTFALIDPFGYKMPMSIIKRLMGSPKSEILVTLVIPSFKRWCKNPSNEKTLDELFKTPDWREICNMGSSKDKDKLIRELYIKQLQKYANIKYTWFFEMINKHNQVALYLIFGTNNWRGLEEMKNVMWNVDSTGNYNFSDLSEPSQMTLIDYTSLNSLSRQKELEKLSGQTMTILDVRKHLTINTPYPTKRLKKDVLEPMEKSGKIIPLTKRKTKRISYSPDNNFKIKFC